MASISRTPMKLVVTRCLGQSLSKHSCFVRPSLQLVCQRGYLSREFLKLDQFEENVNHMAKKFGDVVPEFKKQFVARLDDDDAEILAEDCVSYMHLAGKDDIHHIARAIQRCEAQKDKDLQMGVASHMDVLTPIGLRKCYTLNAPEVALDVYNSSRLDAGVITSIALIMDILYENKRYEECLDLSLSLLERERKITNNWFYQMSITSAFKLNTLDALTKAAKLYDMKLIHQVDHHGGGASGSSGINSSRSVSARLQLMLAFFCVRQNHVNAGLTLLRKLTTEHENYRTHVVTANVQAWAFLETGNVTKAVEVLQSYHRQTNDNKTDKEMNDGTGPRSIAFYDLFIKLKGVFDATEKGQYTAEKKFWSYLIKYFGSLVRRDKLEDFLVPCFDYKTRKVRKSRNTAVKPNAVKPDVVEPEAAELNAVQSDAVEPDAGYASSDREEVMSSDGDEEAVTLNSTDSESVSEDSSADEIKSSTEGTAL